jgi:hypothetical protein
MQANQSNERSVARNFAFSDKKIGLFFSKYDHHKSTNAIVRRTAR